MIHNPCPPTHWRFCEKSFRKYEPIIIQLIALQPSKPVWFSMDGSLNTHVSRIRDAINSQLTNNFPSVVDNEKLKQIWPTVFVKHNGDSIFIGTQQQWLSSTDTPQQSAQLTSIFSGLVIESPPIEVIKAFMILMNRDLLNKASIKFTSVSSTVMTELEKLSTTSPNIIIDILDPSTFIML